jgi:hypothetical protein
MKLTFFFTFFGGLLMWLELIIFQAIVLKEEQINEKKKVKRPH